MAVLPLRIYGDPVLRQRAAEVPVSELSTPAFQQFIGDMGETMYENNGLGLAANQVGDLRRVFVADVEQVTENRKRGKRVKDASKRKLLVFINPTVLDSSEEDEVYNEGCLSIPEIEGDVYRPIRIKARYNTLDGELKEEWIEGLLARVFQHEVDHLDGVLFVDRMAESERGKLVGALNRLKRSQENRTATATGSSNS